MGYWARVWVKKKQKCKECGTVFELTSNHPRLYCSYKCAHRQAARLWIRRKRKESR